MKRSTALLRLAGALLLLAVAFQGAAPAAACNYCILGGLCQPCEDGGKRPCQTRVCCGVTTITVCGTCTLHCVPPPG
jgi:hypothetical protein